MRNTKEKTKTIISVTIIALVTILVAVFFVRSGKKQEISMEDQAAEQQEKIQLQYRKNVQDQLKQLSEEQELQGVQSLTKEEIQSQLQRLEELQKKQGTQSLTQEEIQQRIQRLGEMQKNAGQAGF